MPRYALTYACRGQFRELVFEAVNRDEARGYWRGFRTHDREVSRVRLFDGKRRQLAGPPPERLVYVAHPCTHTLPLESE